MAPTLGPPGPSLDPPWHLPPSGSPCIHSPRAQRAPLTIPSPYTPAVLPWCVSGDTHTRAQLPGP